MDSNLCVLISTVSMHLMGKTATELVQTRWNGFKTDFEHFSSAKIDATICDLPLWTDSYQVDSYQLPIGMMYAFRYGSGILLTNENYTNCCFLGTTDLATTEILLERLFCAHAFPKQMLRLHCATIDDHGRGILFLGPSGIGKTTQAERWMQYRGSTIINGDVGLVQRTESGYLAWGTPWHGSSPYCLNASVPVKALVVLKQAPENRLHQLTGFEKVAEVSGSVFYPTWLENGMELCTDTLNHLLTDLPVYRLDNRADEEAVNLLAAELDRIT